MFIEHARLAVALRLPYLGFRQLMGWLAALRTGAGCRDVEEARASTCWLSRTTGPLLDQVRDEPGLVERILADVGKEVSHLALLEFALTVLWERQQDHILTHAVYEELGAVTGALARHAEEVYHNALQVSEQVATRLFVPLVRPGGLTESTRRVARRSELDESLWPVAQRLAATRLVVTGRDGAGVETVELAHEALIAGWDRLRQWVPRSVVLAAVGARPCAGGSCRVPLATGRHRPPRRRGGHLGSSASVTTVTSVAARHRQIPSSNRTGNVPDEYSWS